jgi:hypothetical protein
MSKAWLHSFLVPGVGSHNALDSSPCSSRDARPYGNGSPRDWQNGNPTYNSPRQVGIKLHGCGLQDETIKIALKYTRGLTILDCVRSVTTDSGHGPAGEPQSFVDP